MCYSLLFQSFSTVFRNRNSLSTSFKKTTFFTGLSYLRAWKLLKSNFLNTYCFRTITRNSLLKFRQFIKWNTLGNRMNPRSLIYWKELVSNCFEQFSSLAFTGYLFVLLLGLFSKRGILSWWKSNEPPRKYQLFVINILKFFFFRSMERIS